LKPESKDRIPQGAPPPGKKTLTDEWKSHPFLQGLDPGQIAPLEDYAMPMEFKPGQIIFREGEMANRFYLIMEGRVALEADVPDRPPILVGHVEAGDVLGWSWLFPPYGWNFTALAVEQTRAVFFYGTWLRERCDADVALGYALMKRTAAVVIRRLQATRQQLIRASA
jgi:CRP-like cAMP-binding protein